jgi:hypothetical protein
MILFITTAVKTSNPTRSCICVHGRPVPSHLIHMIVFYFLHPLCENAVGSLHYTELNDRNCLMNSELERMRKEAVVA